MSTTVVAFIRSAPGDVQPTLRHIRRKIRTHLPDAREQMSPNGFPVYTVDDVWLAGFAWRKTGPMLYVMATGVLDQFENQLGPLRSGRSCVQWRASRTMTLDQLDVLADDILAAAAKTAI